MKIETIITSVEQVFRYVVPGVIFVFLLKVAYPSNPHFILEKLGAVEFAVLIPCLGMMVYGVHRVFFWAVVDYLFDRLGWFVCSANGQDYSATLSHFISWRQSARKDLLNYLHYRWAILHYTFILAELLILFSFSNEETSVLRTSQPLFLSFAGALFIASFFHYRTMLLVENELSTSSNSKEGAPGGVDSD